MADLRFNVSAETRAATAALGSFAQDVQKKLVNAVRALPNIELTADSTAAQREMKRLRDEMAELANQRVGVDIDAGDALAEMQRLQNELRTLGGSTTEVGVRADVAAAEAALGDVEAEVRRLNGSEAEVEVTADTSGAEREISGFGAAAKTTLAAAGAGAGAILANAFAQNLEMDAAHAKLQAQLGNTGEYSERLGGVAGSLYANAYGESLGEVNEAVRLVVHSGAVMEDATNEQIESITGRVMSLAGAFDQDLGGTINAVAQMVKTGLADSSEEALDVLARGFQQGNDKAGDLLDTFNEYSTQFRKLGVDGETAMGLISQGLREGARDADIVADAFKEFSIRAIDGSDTTIEGFKAIGLNAEQMAAKIARGGPEAAAALDLTLDRLRGMKDPSDQAAAAVALFGTQAEDLGEALFALDPSEATLGRVAGAAQKLDEALGGTMEAKVTALQRGFDGWVRSLVETEGPIGDVAAKVAAFGPMAATAATAIGPLLLALRMNGVAAAIRSGPIAEIDELGNAADRSDRRAGGLKKTLLGLGAGVAIGGIAVALDDMNVAAAKGEENLQGVDEQLHNIVGAGEEIMSMNFTGIWDEIVREFQGLDSKLPDINIDVNADPVGAAAAMNDLMSQINTRSAKVNIDGNPAPAAFALRKILDDIGAGKETVLINGEPMPALEALNYVKGLINDGTGEVTINGETMPASEALGRFFSEVDTLEGKVTIGADPAIALAQLDRVQTAINTRMGSVTIDGNPMPADQALGAVLAAIDRGAASVEIDGKPFPADEALAAVINNINTGTGTVVINGNPVPAGDVLAALIASISTAQGTSTIDGNPTPAYNELSRWLGDANRTVGTVQADANANYAESRLNYAARDRYMTIHATTSHVSQGGKTVARGAIVRMENGGLVNRAQGGVELTPMAGGIAQIVPPNTWRVVGDRAQDDEFYIPDDETSRSLAIGTEWARRRGMALVPRRAVGLASGGVVPADDDSFEGNSYHSKNRGKAGAVQAEDGSWVMPSYYSGSGGAGSGGISAGPMSLGTFTVTARAMAGGGVVGPRPAKGAELSVSQAKAGYFIQEDGSVSNFADRSAWQAPGLESWRQQTMAKAVARAQRHEATRTAGSASAGGEMASRVAAAVGQAQGITAAHGDAIVGELRATRAEIHALRGDAAKGNYGAAQLAALRSLAGALQQARRDVPASAAAQDGLTKSVVGAW